MQPCAAFGASGLVPQLLLACLLQPFWMALFSPGPLGLCMGSDPCGKLWPWLSPADPSSPRKAYLAQHHVEVFPHSSSDLGSLGSLPVL